MSGRDERPMRDYPRCPYCNDFYYWEGVFGMDGAPIYFNPLDFQDIAGVESVRVYDELEQFPRLATKEEVLGVTKIYCNQCHHVPRALMHQNIIKMAMTYIERERRKKDIGCTYVS